MFTFCFTRVSFNTVEQVFNFKHRVIVHLGAKHFVFGEMLMTINGRAVSNQEKVDTQFGDQLVAM